MRLATSLSASVDLMGSSSSSRPCFAKRKSKRTSDFEMKQEQKEAMEHIYIYMYNVYIYICFVDYCDKFCLTRATCADTMFSHYVLVA